MNVKQVIEKALGQVLTFHAYRCSMELYSWENGKRTAAQRYLYRRPGDIRIEQTGLFRTGSVVVMRSNGKVVARGGGALSAFKVRLNRNSDFLKGVTGDSAAESDWGTIYRRILQLERYVTSSNWRSVIIGSPRGFEVTLLVKKHPYDRVTVYIREDGPILLLDRYKGTKLLSRVEWKDIEINPAVTDRDFQI